MSNVNTVLAAVMSAGVSALAAAVKTSHKLDGQIYGSAVTVSAIAAYRIGKAWNLGEEAEVKETKFANAKREFINHFVAEGNALYRDSESLKEFQSIKRNRDAAKVGPLVRAYFAAAKAAGFSKQEHAIAEVGRYAKKIVDDMAKNHAGFMKTLGAKENVAEILKVFGEFVAENYGTTIYALAAYFKADPKAKEDGASDPMEKATLKLLEITSVEELAATIKRLQGRLDELSNGVAAAIVASDAHAAQNAGRASEVEPEAERIAA
ncbi:hypothetical protein [Methylobacterium sp. WL120]|uniref:hypothetical protein n=1 Tax=Methylobacterium sp. WL120 TaxID=2603887 RepID=UPI0011C94EC9|nr:hypothetical protein [Methylobacterium sp. WL120]TXM69678.1 hypothetical protein FV229_04855 [Methylobacterium sp. WL120]